MRKTFFLLLAALLVCELGCKEENKCNCGPNEICINGKCVPVSQDADADIDVVPDVAPDRDALETVDTQEEDVIEDDVDEQGDCEQACMDDQDCDDGNPCTVGRCSNITGCCVWDNAANYTPCGNDLYCDGEDYCIEGECVHEDVECTSESPCEVVECNEEQDRCDVTVLPDGTSCEDGTYCDGENNVCMGGECPPMDPCPAFTSNPCTHWVCYETEPHCVEEARPDGDSCMDSDPCNGAEYCRGGECSEVIPACFDADPCTEDICIPSTGACEDPHPVIPGCTDCTGDPACDDGDACTDDYCRNVGGEIECENIYNRTCS